MKHIHALWLIIGLFFTFNTLLSAQSEFKYSYMPKKVYENQLFPVTVIGIGEDGSNPPQFTFDPSSQIKPLFDQPLIVQNGNDSFYTFYFKASRDDIRIPSLYIRSSFAETSLNAHTIFIKSLTKRNDFSNVLAADMKIKNSQVSNYDEKSHIVTLSIEAFEANIEDMDLNNTQESGIENISREFAKVEAEFYVVLPVKEKQLKFTYFNTIKNQYITLKVPVVVEDATVTTQSDLNPKEDSFEKLKKYTFMSLVAFFFIMFLFRRDFFYLVLGVVSLITLLTFYIPHKEICINQGATLYILPSETSTVSTRIDAELKTLLLGERTGYKKVEYKEGIIGWIKNEDLCKP